MVMHDSRVPAAATLSSSGRCQAAVIQNLDAAAGMPVLFLLSDEAQQSVLA